MVFFALIGACSLTIVFHWQSTVLASFRHFIADEDASVRGKRCNSDTLGNKNVVSEFECVGTCARMEGCVSLFYNDKTGMCQMHDNNFNIASCAPQNEEGSKYFVMDRSRYNWTYLGCYKDANIRDINTEGMSSGTKNSVTSCVFYCYQAGYKYSGVQNRYYCCCGNSYGLYGPLAETRCNQPCTDNPIEICGGRWANSVYSTGL